MPFAGFPPEALTFYAALAQDNTKTFWRAHKDVYEDAVREPMELLLEELRDEFGIAKVFRPYRNVRFSKDKTPYKTAQAALVAHDGHGAGHRYIEINPTGLRLGGGRYHPDRDELERTRQAIANPDAGAELEQIKAELERRGLTYMPAELRTAPRGFPRDHPRIDLLRRKRHAATKTLQSGPWLHTTQAKDHVVTAWHELGPFIAWLERHAAGTAA
jgi:uncharacterized protein (TIGR02453 family)